MFNGTELPNTVVTREMGQGNLDVERRPEIREKVNVVEEVPETVRGIEEDEHDRFVGRLVCGIVVNLPWREPSEEDVSLLSQGLKTLRKQS